MAPDRSRPDVEPPERGHRRGERVRRRAGDDRRGAGPRPCRAGPGPGRPLPRRSSAASPGWPIPPTLPVSNSWRPGSAGRTGYGAHCCGPSSARSCGQPAPTRRRRSCSRPIDCSGSRNSRPAGLRSACSTERSPAKRSARGSSSAARAARRPTGSPSTRSPTRWRKGVLAEAFRWAELEQLVYSPSRWERRLIGSTIATLPFTDRTAGRRPDVAARGLALLGQLIGDAEPDVQKALAWAYRSITVVDAGSHVRRAGPRIHPGRGRRAMGTARGSSSDSLSKVDPALARRSAPASTESVGRRADRRPRTPRRPPPASPPSVSGDRCPNHP